MVKTFLKTAVLICVAALAAACAGPSSAYRTAINGRIARGDLEGALRQVDSSKRTEYSRKILYSYSCSDAARYSPYPSR